MGVQNNGDSSPAKREKAKKSCAARRLSRARSIAHDRAQATAPHRRGSWRRRGVPSGERASERGRETESCFSLCHSAAHAVSSRKEGVACSAGSGKSIASRSVRLRGARSIASSHARAWSRLLPYQIHRLRGPGATEGPCRKARGFAKAQREQKRRRWRVVFFFFFESFSALALAPSPLLSLSLFHAKTHQSGGDQSGTRQRPTWRATRSIR